MAFLLLSSVSHAKTWKTATTEEKLKAALQDVYVDRAHRFPYFYYAARIDGDLAFVEMATGSGARDCTRVLRRKNGRWDTVQEIWGNTVSLTRKDVLEAKSHSMSLLVPAMVWYRRGL